MDNSIEQFLVELGLTAKEIRIYLMLVKKGPLTVLELSRQTNINRTQTYRLVEQLQTRGVVEVIVDEYRQVMKAADVSTLEMLVTTQEVRTAYLRESLPGVTNMLMAQLSTQDPQTKVLFYKGGAGIRQMIWHTLNTNKIMYGYSYQLLDEIGGAKLAARWQEEWIKRKLVMHELCSEDVKRSIESKQNQRVSTQDTANFVLRYLPASMLNINLQMDIYNDVVAYYDWHDNEIFGVEIHNQKIADLQRQLFLLAWAKAS